MLARIKRILHHRLLDEADTRKAIPPALVQRLTERVAASERRHTGEIRICVEASLPTSYLLRDATPRQRAITMFGKLRVWDTEQNNGVLVYLLLAEHAIEIVADRGLARAVPQAEWDGLCRQVETEFRAGRHAAGALAAIDGAARLLEQYFPATAPVVPRNELPDQPLLL